MDKEMAYYPGCVARSTGLEYDISTRSVAMALGVELLELPDWNCCGATHCSNELLATGLAARVMGQAKKPLLVSCSICFSNLRVAAAKLEDPNLRDRINALLEMKYDPQKGAEVKHVVQVIADSLVGEGGADRVVVPLQGIKVAPYYGCLLTRPPGGLDSPENPQILERLISALKGEPVDYPLKMFCCGGPVFMARDEPAAGSALAILRSARSAGAQVLVTVCPLCHLMLDAKQKALESHYGEEIGLPVLYITQLAGIALGLGPEDLGLEGNSVSPMPLLEEIYSQLSVQDACEGSEDGNPTG